VLPLRGKILNVASASADKLRQNQELKDLIEALGCGAGDRFDLGRLRYGRIVIMTDADVDGAHISTLLLTLFYRHMPQVIENGHLFIAKPPLYLLSAGRRKKVYIYDDSDLEDKLEYYTKLKQAGKADPAAEEPETVTEEGEAIEDEEPVTDAQTVASIEADDEEQAVDNEMKDRLKAAGFTDIQRYKGLGEMNAEQLWETTMDPANRVLMKVSVEDAERADAIFNKLMGEEVLLRKNFIQTHAKDVVNLDI
jgi:DNA gyrase subunit B